MGEPSFARGLREALAEGADPNEVFGELRTSALHGAALNGDAEAMELLAAYGADLNLQDRRGCTPLHYAVGYDLDGALQTKREVTFDGTRTLLKLGASIRIANSEGETPRDLACAYGEDFALLLDRLTTGGA